MTIPGVTRWAWAEVDLTAIAHNVSFLREVVAPAELWAVVKADGYGHGAADVAGAALEAGATGLCVALTAEGVALRVAGFDAPILVLSHQPPEEVPALVAQRLTPTVYTAAYADTVADAVAARGGGPVGVHVKVDTGMQRVGVNPTEAAGVVAHVAARPQLALAGIFTHLACADTPGHAANVEQLEVFDAVIADLDRQGVRPPLVHAANSAGAIAVPAARRSLVRVGIAMYGISPGPLVDHLIAGLRPALSLRARVSYVKRVRAGSHVSYGWRHRFDADTMVATVPIGYADGVPRRLGSLPDRSGAEVLIGGRRRPIVGVVTMDQLMVDVGDMGVAVGDEVVLIGEQGGHAVRAEDWAERLGTIGYEIVCAITSRVPRITVRESGDRRPPAS
jgi:alanine racemase